MQLSNKQQTMSTREIAELTGKKHLNVLRDARQMLTELHGKGGELNFESSYVSEQNKTLPQFLLPYRETMILVSGYNLQMRAKIIDRWQELEAATKPRPLSLDDPHQLRHALLSYSERVIALEAKVIEDAPKVESYEALIACDEGQSMADVAQACGTGRNR